MMRLILVIAALLLGAPPAAAHAFLTRASPAVGSTIRSAPAEITLRFSERIEPAFSSLQVTGPNGERVDGADMQVKGTEPMVMHASLRKLAAGTHKVVWRVVSVDTHVTDGDFTFTVAP